MTAAQIAHFAVFALLTGIYLQKVCAPWSHVTPSLWATGAEIAWMVLHTLWYTAYLLLHLTVITFT